MEHQTIHIDALTPEQKRKLYEQLAYEFRPGSHTAKDTMSADETLVWNIINDQCHTRRGLDTILAKCGKSYSRVSFGEDVEWLAAWLDRGCSQPINRTQRQALFTTAIECLVRYLDRSNATITHVTLIQNLLKAPLAVDAGFPGYQDARILDRLAAIAA